MRATRTRDPHDDLYTYDVQREVGGVDALGARLELLQERVSEMQACLMAETC